MGSDLPSHLTERAHLSGMEYGWRLDDFLDVLHAAASEGYVCTGGQIQWRPLEGTAEAYWLSIESSTQKEGEPWMTYVYRAAQEIEDDFERLIRETDFVEVAREFEVLRRLQSEGVNLNDHLYIVAYFESVHASEPPMQRRYTTPLGLALIAMISIGIFLHALLFVRDSSDFGLLLAFFGTLPYGVALLFTSSKRSLWPAVCAAALPLALDLLIYYDVFISPSGSTAALALLFAPFWNLFVVAPVSGIIAMVVISVIDRKRS